MFLCLAEQEQVNAMYRFSLSFFVKLFKLSLQTVSQTNEAIQVKLTTLLVDATAPAMLKEDRPVFALSLAKALRPESFNPEEFLFLVGLSALPPVKKSLPAWCKSTQAQSLF